MKKLLSFLLCLILCLSLFACNSEAGQTTKATNKTQQTEGTKNTQQTQATSGTTSPNTHGADTNNENGHFYLEVQNNRVSIPDKKIDSISVNKTYKNLKYTGTSDINKIVQAIANMELYELPDGSHVPSGRNYTLLIRFNDNTYTRLYFYPEIIFTYDPSATEAEKKTYYAAVDEERMKEFQEAIEYPDSYTFLTQKDAEILNGKVSFEVTPIVEITKYYYNKDYSLYSDYSDFIQYNTLEAREAFTELFSSLNFVKLTATDNIPNYSQYVYAKFKFYYRETYTDIRMIEYESEFFFEINGEFYTLSDEDLGLLRSSISLAL